MDAKGIIFRVGGGFGKCLAATRVAKQIKEKHKDLPLTVQTSYPDAFVGLDFVDAYYPYGAPLPDFYDKHKCYEIAETEPYQDLDYRAGQCHLIDAWCRRLDVAIPEDKTPIIRLSKAEKRAAEMIMGQVRNQAQGRPVVALQWVGGTSYHHQQAALDPLRQTQVRELPQDIAQAAVNDLVAGGAVPVQIGLPTEARLQNVIPLLTQEAQAFPIRVTIACLALCDGALLIDSFAAHAWSGLGKKNAVVVWGATRPKNLGYLNQINLEPAKNCCPVGGGCNRPDMHLGDWVGTGNPWQCPHDGACMGSASYNGKELAAKVLSTLAQEKKVEAA
jgi:hypothetical protein